MIVIIIKESRRHRILLALLGSPVIRIVGAIRRLSMNNSKSSTSCTNLEAAVAAGEVSYDCILVLGGGVPLGPSTCLPFVANRCDAAVKIRAAHATRGDGTEQPPLLCLSAGTAHAPQLLSSAGLPIWEATVSAAHCLAQVGPTFR